MRLIYATMFLLNDIVLTRNKEITIIILSKNCAKANWNTFIPSFYKCYPTRITQKCAKRQQKTPLRHSVQKNSHTNQPENWRTTVFTCTTSRLPILTRKHIALIEIAPRSGSKNRVIIAKDGGDLFARQWNRHREMRAVNTFFIDCTAESSRVQTDWSVGLF